MSDPMTNTEVEDVLSSIRRLVSDEKRTEPAAEAEPASDRLVLTPSLRVLDDDAGDTPAEDMSEVTPEADAAHEETADSQDEGAAEEERGESAPMLLEPNVDTDTQEDEHATEEAFDVEDAVQDDDADEHDDVLDQPVGPEGAVEEVAHAPETLGEKIAALETLIAGRTDEFEPDEAGSDAYAGTQAPAMEWEDAEEDDTPDTGHHEPAFSPHVDAAVMPEPDTDTPILSSDDDVLDEEALRELVSDIVREELQGALGERITRNVRKLVRREIHRALAAQDLE